MFQIRFKYNRIGILVGKIGVYKFLVAKGIIIYVMKEGRNGNIEEERVASRQ